MTTAYPVATRTLLTNNSGAVTIPICTPVYIVSADKIASGKADASGTARLFALTMAAIAGAASGFCATEGVLVATTAQWDIVTGGSGGLTANAIYYLSSATAGLITTTAPTTGYVVEIGIAASTTELNIQIKQPVKLSTAAAGQGGINLSAQQVAYADATGKIVGSANMRFDGTTLLLANLQVAAGLGLVPIGSIIAWVKGGSTPVLPDGWVECNGQVLSDAASVYNGQIITDLNSSNRFLRGNSTSGATGGEDAHALSVAELAAHTHTVPDGTGYLGNTYLSQTGVTAGAGVTSGSAGSGTAHENKPPYFNVVWIIRIK
jgi:microcystin-dependent protein